MRTIQSVSGDTWDTLAKRAYNNEKLADILMSNNQELLDIFIFSAGVTVVVPEIEEPTTSDPLPPWR